MRTRWSSLPSVGDRVEFSTSGPRFVVIDIDRAKGMATLRRTEGNELDVALAVLNALTVVLPAGKVIPDANDAAEVVNPKGGKSTWCRACDATFVVRGFPPKGRDTFTCCPFCAGGSENFL